MGKKILKVALILVLVGILAGLTTWLVLLKSWPWWVGAAVFVGLIGVWLGILFVKRYLQRRREKVFVERVVAQDEAVIKGAPIHERQKLQELQDRWKDAVERLRSSHLRRRGNPLYALPWYLVIGESGLGKTSAIMKAGLSSSFTDIGPATALSATRNCDWWFFEDAIVLDTAGRYTIPIEEGPDREEWKKFLVLLAKYRRREPLNGVIVTVSADKLLHADTNQLREDGQSVRQRIDQLMRTTGAKFPVYLLVTKMDLVHGFVDFCDRLSKEDLAQAMGSINEKMNPYGQEFLVSAFSEISGRLKDLRFAMVNERTQTEPGALFFPSEFEQLKPGIQLFSQSVFEENPYQETPLFRGLYFSSARRQGQPQSEFLRTSGIVPSAGQSTPGEDGIFLADIFRDILPRDRYLYRPIREFLRWRVLTSSHALLAWTMVWLSLCGILSYSFLKNSLAIGNFVAEFNAPVNLTADMSSDLLILDKFRIKILEMERENKDWWMPRFGLEESLETERKIKKGFTRLFEERFLNSLHLSFERQIENISPHTPSTELALYASYLLHEIRLHQMVLQGEKFAHVVQFDNICTTLILKKDPQVIPAIASRFDDLYYAYLNWHENRAAFQRRLQAFQEALTRFLEKRGGRLEWLVDIPVTDVRDVYLRDFWGGDDDGSRSEQVGVPKAYTGEGRKQITNFLAMLDKALPHEKIPGEDKVAFRNWYWAKFFESWARFARQFNRDVESPAGVSSKNTVALMATGQNPYFRFLDRMSQEFAQAEKGKPHPPWASLVMLLNQIKHISKAEEEKAKGTLAGKIEVVKEKLVGKAKETVDGKEAKKYEEKLKVAKVWEEYEKSLVQLLPVTTSRDTCLTMISEYFQQGGGEKQPAFLYAYNEGYKLKSMMGEHGDDRVVWDLVFGPFNFLLDYGIMNAGCILQDKWVEQVLGALEGVGGDKALQVLFDKSDGAVWKFVEGPAKPFVMKSKKGYVARKSHERTIPFHRDFYDFLNAGTERIAVSRPDYDVTMETLPLEVNEGSNLKPYASIISLDCSGGKVSLENYNYPQSRIFKWNPDKCGDVTLKILLPDMVLTKTYEGPMGFPVFLSGFSYGIRTFRAEDFPEQQKRLTDMGISWIRLSYKISGKAAVVQLLKSASVTIPEEIVECPLQDLERQH